MLISKIAYLFSLLPGIAGLLLFRRLSLDAKVLTVFFVFVALLNSWVVYLGLHHKNNLWLISFDALIEGIFLPLFLSIWLSKNLKSIAYLACLIFIAVCVYQIANNSFFNLNASSEVLKGIEIACLSSLCLANFAFTTKEKIVKTYRFWMLSGLLLYHFLTLTIFAVSKLVFSDNEPVLHDIWTFHNIIEIFCNFLFLIGYLCIYQNRNLST